MRKLYVIITILFSLSTSDKLLAMNQFSLILKPSPLGGIGLFATHDIKKGTKVIDGSFLSKIWKIKDIPEEFLKYVVYLNLEECEGPERFDRMENIWYLNHSDTPNISRAAPKIGIAIVDIKAGDEITMDYNQFNEPEEFKESYYSPNKEAQKPLTIFAQITPKAEFFQDAKQAILNIIPQTLAEPGCRMFTLHEAAAENGNVLFLYEVWDNMNAYKFHHAQEYTKAVFVSYQEWLEKPVQIIKLDKVSGD